MCQALRFPHEFLEKLILGEFKASDCIFACARIQLAPFFSSILIEFKVSDCIFEAAYIPDGR